MKVVAKASVPLSKPSLMNHTAAASACQGSRGESASLQVVQQQSGQAGPSTTTAAPPVVLELVESSKMGILPSAPAPLPTDEPECVNSPEDVGRARRGLVTLLTDQLSAQKKIKVEAVEAGESARDRAEELMERNRGLVLREQQMVADRQALDTQLHMS